MREMQLGGSGQNQRSVWRAMGRGAMGRCPHCGEGKLFCAFLKVNDSCEACGEEYHHHRADDLPAYIVIVIVGHLVVSKFMIVQATLDLPMWAHMAIWGPLTLLLSVVLLQPVKGAVVGLQWALKIHGFGGETDDHFYIPGTADASGSSRE
ncbi:MAG: DUF983 domain-containing protein [Mesorhizobium sp.]|nr:DUF983 domain-containing protein [Mesorhizobium sp.]